MKWVKLGDIIRITSGGTPLTSKREYYDNGTIRWVKTGDLKKQFLFETPDRITQLGLENSSAKIFPANTVLIAMYGATIGNCSILKIAAATNQACAALLPTENINEEYLYFYLRTIKQQLIDQGVGGGQPNISATILKKTNFPLIPLKDQIQIANILSKAEALISQRKESLRLLDELLRSTFLEMFGDPIKNPKKWDTKLFGDIIESIRYGTSTPPDYQTYGIPFIRATNVKKGRVSRKDLVFISDAEAAKIPKCKIKEGDLIIVRSGANTGDAVTIPKEFNNAYAAFDLIVTLNRISSIFYNELINSEFGRAKIKPLTQRSGQPHLNSDQVKSLRFYSPPMKLQTKFSHVVEKTEALIAKYQTSLQELENLFGSLSQRAFKGELNLK